jgi:hypothetical protein
MRKYLPEINIVTGIIGIQFELWVVNHQPNRWVIYLICFVMSLGGFCLGILGTFEKYRKKDLTPL